MFLLISSQKSLQHKNVLKKKVTDNVNVLFKSLAKKLQRKTDRLNSREQKTLLGAFTLFSAAICVFIIVTSLTTSTKSILTITTVQTPALINPKEIKNPAFTKQYFKRYFDSLNTALKDETSYPKTIEIKPEQRDSFKRSQTIF